MLTPKQARWVMLGHTIFLVLHALWRYPLQQVSALLDFLPYKENFADRFFFYLCVFMYIIGAFFASRKARRGNMVFFIPGRIEVHNPPGYKFSHRGGYYIFRTLPVNCKGC